MGRYVGRQVTIGQVDGFYIGKGCLYYPPIRQLVSRQVVKQARTGTQKKTVPCSLSIHPSWCIIGGFWFTLAQAVILLKLVPQLIGLFDNSSGNISPENIHKLSKNKRRICQTMVINDFFFHKICGFNRNFGVLFFKICLYSSVDLMSFSIFWGKFRQIFHATTLEKKRMMLVVDIMQLMVIKILCNPEFMLIPLASAKNW